MSRILILLIRGYQLVISPLLGPRCRFAPSCSAYAIAALAAHGPVHGGWLALRRLARCQPWGGEGFDPVPPACGCAPLRGAAARPTCLATVTPHARP